MIRKHILAETSAEAEQLQLKRARLVINLNDKGSHWPGPMELIHKNIPPIHSSIKQDITETEITKTSGERPSCDDLVPSEHSGTHSPLNLVPLSCPPEKLAGRTIPSLTQTPPPPSHLQPLPESFLSLELTNGAKEPNQSMKTKSNLRCPAHTHKKHVLHGPKIKKLKYHQYIPPEQKGDKQPPPLLDSSYTHILQQQQQQRQLFLQLQILSEQQQHNISHPPLPAPSKPMKDQLNKMKVAQLKSELKLRSLPVYGNKNDLVGRLRAYEELNGGCDITSSPTAGGIEWPAARGARKSSRTASPNTTSQELFQRSSITPQPADANRSRTPPTTTQQPMACSGTVSSPPISLIPCVQQPAAKSPEDSSFSSDPLGEMISSPLTHVSLQACSVSRLSTDIKEEHPCSTPSPCQVSLKPAFLRKHCPGSSAAHTSRTTAPVLTVDKDKMLREKDKQIEELTRELRQKQKLVEVLKMQLEIGKRGGRVKQERCSYGHSPLSAPPSSMDAAKLTVKQEAVEAEEVVPETTLRSPDTCGHPQLLMQEAPKPIQLQLQINPEPISAHTRREEPDCLQQTTLRPTQQRATEKLRLQQQHNIHETLENLQHLQTSRKQQQHGQSKKHLQQMQLKKQTSSLKQQIKVQGLINQPQQIQIQIKLKQQQVLIPKNPQLQQVSDDSNPTLVTDSNRNRFLIELTSHVTEKQRTNALKTTNYLPLQAHSAGVQVSVDQQQAAAQCLSAPPGLKPFFKAPSGKNTLSPSSQTDTEAGEDFIDLILQTKEVPTVFKPEPDLSLDCLSPNSSTFSSSPLQLSHSPLISPSCDTAQLQSEPERLVDPTEDKQHHSNTACMEDWDSTMEKPLLGEEPGGLLVLIDDFHSQMLCSPSLPDYPPSPMDTFHMVAEAEQKLNFNDWLDLTMGGDTHEETSTLDPLGPQTPCGIFSADFLDNYIME
ncbi:myocardin-related transcription factor A-like [Channa argus]|uniref:myocardin-related transcription factor A-like n=1 Tax=Channa argus TaxID=215402 RepID=UPI00351FBADA